jgi:hypothetical protein
MSTSETSDYARMTPQQLSERLGLTVEEAEAVLGSWNRSLPESEAAQTTLRTAAIQYEYEMRGLNYDLSTGRITQDEYYQKEFDLYQRYFR